MKISTNGTSILCVFLALFCNPIGALAQPRIIAPGEAVVTGFSGVIAPDPKQPRPSAKGLVDLTFIDPDGASAQILDLSRPGVEWNGTFFDAPRTLKIPAKTIGQVFGIALDDAMPPNIYFSATSAFGLNIVGRKANGTPERRKVGGPGTGWMAGQFGLDLLGGPGSIYKVDGKTGAVTLFAEVLLNGATNPGPALGTLAFDAEHRQILVSDLYTGMVHRFLVANGSEPGPPFDHGMSGRAAAGLAPIAFDPSNRPNIASQKFHADNPSTWGFAPPERRVFGLAVHEGRLFYSVGNGARTQAPEIWSVGLGRDGSFADDPRFEVAVPERPGPYAVSDIIFSEKGAMILAQRAPIVASYDYSAFTAPGEPRVLRYWPETPDDPATPEHWTGEPEEYAVGFAGSFRNTNGGVALGYGYDEHGVMSTAGCEFSLWTTGQNLRNAPSLRAQLEPGGPLIVDGLMAVPSSPVRPFNEPPWMSYAVDYDGRPDNPKASGHLGGVRIFSTPCAEPTAFYGGPGFPGEPPYVVTAGGGGGGGDGGSGGGGGGGGGDGGGGCASPPCGPPPPPPPSACFASTGRLACANGQWVYTLNVSGPAWANTASATSLTPGVTTPGGPRPLNPASFPITGAPGTVAVLDICVFDAAAAASGKPYDCCHSKVRVRIPSNACEGKK